MTPRFRITKVKRIVDGFRYRVTPSAATRRHIQAIIDERISAGTNGYSEGDQATTLFTTKADARFHVRRLIQQYGCDRAYAIPDDTGKCADG